MVISKLGWRKSLRGRNIFRPYIGYSVLKVKDHNPPYEKKMQQLCDLRFYFK